MVLCGFMVYTVKDLLWIYEDLFSPKWIYGVHNFGQMFTPRKLLNFKVDPILTPTSKFNGIFLFLVDFFCYAESSKIKIKEIQRTIEEKKMF